MGYKGIADIMGGRMLPDIVTPTTPDFTKLELVAERGGEKIYKCGKVHTTGAYLDKSGHLYYNESKGLWHCFKCAADGVKSGGYIHPSEGGKPEELVSKALEAINTEHKEVQEKFTPPDVVSFEITPYRVKAALAKYLADRNLIYRDIVRYDIKYYSLGPVQSSTHGAVYIPFYTFDPTIKFEGDKNKFLTYYQLRFIIGAVEGTHINPKGLPAYPKLYLNTWDYKPEPMVIVEGVFDAIRVRKLGYSSVALCGKSIGLLQLNKLLSLNPSKYVILLDRDALGNATDNLNLLRPFTDKPVILIILTTKDPASTPTEDLKALLRDI